MTGYELTLERPLIPVAEQDLTLYTNRVIWHRVNAPLCGKKVKGPVIHTSEYVHFTKCGKIMAKKSYMQSLTFDHSSSQHCTLWC
jgi:hypothetical protein